MARRISPKHTCGLIVHNNEGENNCQYIASLNESHLKAMKHDMEDPSHFDRLFTSNTVLELTDDSDSGKLLGITVDLVYDPRNRDD